MANIFGKRSKKLDVGRNLPPLYHKLPWEPYDVKKSEVIQWLMQQPSILEFIWDQYKQSGEIIFNRDTEKWQGVDYDKLCPHRESWDNCPVCCH